ncbi:MAG: hypothetical protein ABIP06_12265 [Pyrinomonadaceae bacterium]
MPKSGLLCSNLTFMVSIRMIAFRKNSNCPASPKLLAFEKGETKTLNGEVIRKHLLECEFCSAELEFYARYPQSEEPVGKAEIPPYLFELAESLLRNKHKEFKSLNKLFSELDSPKIVRI